MDNRSVRYLYFLILKLSSLYHWEQFWTTAKNHKGSKFENSVSDFELPNGFWGHVQYKSWHKWAGPLQTADLFRFGEIYKKDPKRKKNQNFFAQLHHDEVGLSPISRLGSSRTTTSRFPRNFSGSRFKVDKTSSSARTSRQSGSHEARMKYFPFPEGPPTGMQICRLFPVKLFSSEFVTSNFWTKWCRYFCACPVGP